MYIKPSIDASSSLVWHYYTYLREAFIYVARSTLPGNAKASNRESGQ